MTLRSFALLFFVALPLLAQEKNAPPSAPVQAPAAGPITVTLSFAGGALADFCQQIRSKEPRANIVVAANAADATLPAMDLRGAGLYQALEGACLIAESPYQIRMKDCRGNGEPAYTIGEPVYTIIALMPQVPGQQPGKRESTEVFSLNRITEGASSGGGITPATVLSAIETAVGGPHVLQALLYHKDSGLMIVRATPDQLGIVNDVLRNLEKDVDARRRAAAEKRANEVPPAPDPRKESPADPAPPRPKR
jgi:hypothetical protein